MLRLTEDFAPELAPELEGVIAIDGKCLRRSSDRASGASARSTDDTAGTRYYLLSLLLEPERFLHVTRAHWAIENELHWVLDVTVSEDQARNRMENGPENLAILRRIALNPGSGPGQALARAENSKGSMRGKLKRAA